MRDAKGRNIRAGGSILAFAILAGTIVGLIYRQPSIGFLVGTGAGIVVFGAIWLRDRF
jgi:hypothetical protein